MIGDPGDTGDRLAPVVVRRPCGPKYRMLIRLAVPVRSSVTASKLIDSPAWIRRFPRIVALLMIGT